MVGFAAVQIRLLLKRSAQKRKMVSATARSRLLGRSFLVAMRTRRLRVLVRVPWQDTSKGKMRIVQRHGNMYRAARLSLSGTAKNQMGERLGEKLMIRPNGSSRRHRKLAVHTTRLKRGRNQCLSGLHQRGKWICLKVCVLLHILL